MLGRHARPCESFLICIEGVVNFVVFFVRVFSAFVLGVVPRICVGFSPNYFEGNMDGCFVHLWD
jgi:hypothetical protein